MSGFDIAYEKWINGHLKKRTGERLRRLQKGHGYGEKLLLKEVWWPAIGHFDNLHPEYELQDFGGGYRYLDFAFIRSLLKVDLESDGFGPHSREVTRQEFSYNLMRQNMLTIEGFKILRFSRDDILERPRLCQQMVQQLIGKYMNLEHRQSLDPYEKEIVRLAVQLNGVFTLKHVCSLLGISDKTVSKKLSSLLAKGYIQIDRGEVRKTRYRLTASNLDEL